MDTYRTAARVVVLKPGKMTLKGRRAIATWMRRVAKFLARPDYKHHTFRASYRYKPGQRA